jgi:heme A synthase
VEIPRLSAGFPPSIRVAGVPKWLALAHQAVGVAIYCIAVLIAHRVRSRTESLVHPV